MATRSGRVGSTTIFAGSIVLSFPALVLATPPPSVEREYLGPTSPGATTLPVGPHSPVEPGEKSPPPSDAEPDAEGQGEGDEGDDGFFIEDLSEDPEALERELAVETQVVTGPRGRISGKVKDTATGDPLMGVTIEVIGTGFKTKTDLDGAYLLEIPPGTYELRVREDTHESRRLSNVEVLVDGSTSIDAELKPLAGAGETVIVEAEMPKESSGARLAQRKEAVETRDIMSRDEIAKSGGGSTSAVARRIVGATILDGKYLFVRGLGHRYGNTLLDMARVPSPEPEIRTVPLDVFPSSTLSAINVQKTFSPDVPADFAGASTQLETRAVPDELIFGVGADIGVNTATTGRSGRTDGESFGADWFGFGSIPRSLPDAIPRGEQAAYGATDENFDPRWTPDEIEAQGESFLLDTSLTDMKGMPNFGVDLNVGYGDSIGDSGHAGFLLATQWGSEHQTLRGIERQWGISSGELTPQVTLDTIQTTHNIQWSALGLVKVEPSKNHEISVSGLYSRDADDRALWWQGTANTFASGADAIITRQWYSARSIGFSRLGGEHEFPSASDLKVDWQGSYAQSQRNDPHIRDMVYTRPTGSAQPMDESGFRYDDQNGAGTYTFLDLLDHTESGALNLTLPFKQWTGNLGKVKVGAWVEGKQREFFVRRFKFRVAQGLQDLVPDGTGRVLTPETVGGGTTVSQGGMEPFYLLELTRATDNYRATQEIYASYAMLELPLVRWMKIAGGARFEWNDIEVTPYDLFSDEIDESRVAKLRGPNWLPSLSFVFSPTARQNVRIGGSQTLARPEMRELAPFEFYDFLGGSTVQGNPYLDTTRIWNADLRWEWFPSAHEVLAASAFYKFFDDPIERVVAPRIPLKTTFLNADLAHNVGLELEARKNLEFLAGRKKDENASEAAKRRSRKVRSVLADFSLGVNFAYVFSWVELPADRECDQDDAECNFEQQFDVSTSRERALQGQAPFVLNAFVDYGNDDSGTNVRALFNTFGRYISEVGGLGLPDIYQEPILDLDLVVRQRIYKGLSGTLEVDNALNWVHRKTQDDELTQRWRQGVTFTLGISWNL